MFISFRRNCSAKLFLFVAVEILSEVQARGLLPNSTKPRCRTAVVDVASLDENFALIQ